MKILENFAESAAIRLSSHARDPAMFGQTEMPSGSPISDRASPVRATRSGNAHAEFRFGDQQRHAIAGVAPSRFVETPIEIGPANSCSGAAISRTTPPPMVTTGENMRTIKRSPGRSSRGSRSEESNMRARARLHRIQRGKQPGLRLRPRRCPRESERARDASAGARRASRSKAQSTCWVGWNNPAARAPCRGATSEESMPARFTAVRSPAWARSTGAP